MPAFTTPISVFVWETDDGWSASAKHRTREALMIDLVVRHVRPDDALEALYSRPAVVALTERN